MKDIQTIKPLTGLGMLRFGMTRDEVRSLLGEPEDIDEYSFSGTPDDLSESWHYDNMDLSMSFDAEDDWRLITLAVSSDDYQLEDFALVGKTKKELAQILAYIGYTDVKEENESTLDIPGHELVSEHTYFINFWLEDGVVKEIQWSPRFNDDDEVEWPENPVA